MKAGDLIKWEGPENANVGLVLEANISPVGLAALEKRAKILWDDGSISSVAMWTVEVISSG